VHTTSALPPERKPLAILCVVAVLALLWATLWPFNPYPRNGVTWLLVANGVRFEHSGVILSDEPLKAPANPPAGDACAIEIYLRPVTRHDAGNFLTFSSDDNPDAVFLRQWRESLLIYKSRPIHGAGPKLIEFDVDDVLRIDHPVLITLSSGSRGIVVYIDGKIVAGATHFRIRRDELYRQIVLGNSPSNFQIWHGDIYGLAIYDDEVSPANAAAHFADWSRASSSPSSASDPSHVIAHYDFRERGGNIVKSDVASAPPLIVPAYFSIPRKPMLDSPINEFGWNANYRSDVFQNIVGFMPLGFVLAGFFALSRSRGRAILTAALYGGFLSFCIEFLQYYIPRRGSGWTDVITNTTGTLLGALLARPEWVRGALRLLSLAPSSPPSEARQN
jgi:VanZ like family